MERGSPSFETPTSVERTISGSPFSALIDYFYLSSHFSKLSPSHLTPLVTFGECPTRKTVASQRKDGAR